MSRKNWDKEKKYFMILGLPCLIFVIFVFFTFYILFVSFYLTIFIVLLAGVIKKDKIWSRLTKIGVFMVIVFFINNYNVSHLPNQFLRHSPGGREQLLEPNHPKIKGIRDDFYEWHQKEYNESWQDLSEKTHEDLEFKLKRFDYYIHTEVMEYTYDDQAPYYSSDHVATLDEIFDSDTDGDGLYQDDCDGISLVTASVLLKMGYNAYIAECLSHWNTIVFPKGSNPKTLEGFNEGIHLYNSWGRPSYYIFNEEEVLIPPGRPITLSLYELFTDDSTYKYDYIDYFNGYYIDLPIYLLIIIGYAILFVLSLILYHFVRIGLPGHGSIRKEKIKWFFSKKILKTSFKLSLIGAFIAIIIFWFALSGLGFLGTLIISCTFITLLRYTEYNISSKNRD